ncbi:hypothetical protein PUND_a2963 [Pseudoalteromonas undina]|uniref:Uncharacterized protein n=1 Tax=Pseudoalteromonas issachenkonii TaxID=152297 RepID=A0ABM6N172_9GAMM|nr:hypothetical protein PISS_a0986 [Pseudoalteromonas issachenkonii]KAF7767048.1 hypothetical protein PUND_a2963 [Pseudoalteromonas undina]
MVVIALIFIVYYLIRLSNLYCLVYISDQVQALLNFYFDIF